MTTFARVTPALSNLLWNLPPCAQRLHEWLLQNSPPGQPYEAFLEKFVAHARYSLRHVQRSLDVLLNKGVVEVVHRYSGKIYALIVHDDRTFDFETGTKKSQFLTLISKNGTSMSKTEGSKPHSLVTKNREKSTDNRDTHQLHPVKEDQQGDSLVRPSLSEGQAVLEPPNLNLRQALENTLQQPLNKNIMAVLLQFPEVRARDALDSLQEAMQRGTIHNPAGWFIQAIRKGFKPNSARSSQPQSMASSAMPPEPPKPDLPDGFQLWFELAFKAGIALASEQRADGELIIYGPDCAEPFEQAQQTWPLQKLREMLDKPSAPTPAPHKPSAPPNTPIPSEAAIASPERRKNALARLQAKWKGELPGSKAQAIAEAEHWGFTVSDAGIFEVAYSQGQKPPAEVNFIPCPNLTTLALPS